MTVNRTVNRTNRPVQLNFFLHSIKTTPFWRVYRLPESLETGNPRRLSPPPAAAASVPSVCPRRAPPVTPRRRPPAAVTGRQPAALEVGKAPCCC